MKPSHKCVAECNGMTVLELLISIGIAALLIVLLFVAGKAVVQNSRNVGCVLNLRQISLASLAYSADHDGAWPPNEVNPTDSSKNKVFTEFLAAYLDPYPRRPGANFRNSPLVCPADRADISESNFIYKGVYTPLGKYAYGLSYAQNQSLFSTGSASGAGLRRQAVKQPAHLVLYMDFLTHFEMNASRLNVTVDQGKTRMDFLKDRHGGKFVNAAFADGSVRQVELDTIPTTNPSLFWQGRTE